MYGSTFQKIIPRIQGHQAAGNAETIRCHRHQAMISEMFQGYSLKAMIAKM